MEHLRVSGDRPAPLLHDIHREEPTSAFPNCDVAGCAEWSDMIGYAGVGCLSGHYAGGSYCAAENTIMKSLSYRFEEVNMRISCCTYLQEPLNGIVVNRD